MYGYIHTYIHTYNKYSDFPVAMISVHVGLAQARPNYLSIQYRRSLPYLADRSARYGKVRLYCMRVVRTNVPYRV